MTRTGRHHRDIGHRHGRAAALAAVLTLSVGGNAAHAALVNFISSPLDFDTGTQSIWGGASSAGFVRSGVALGSSGGTNVSYRVAASSGSMSAVASGWLAASYRDSVAFADSRDVSMALNFVGVPKFFPLSSSFRSDVGASVSVTGTLDLGAVSPSLEIFGADYELNIRETFTAETPVTATDGDSFTASGVGVGLPTFGIGVSGDAGVDLDITQDASVRLSHLNGTAVATHADSGKRRAVDFELASSGPLDLDLDLGLAGRWDIGFEAVRMFGSYSSLFTLDILPFIGGGIGVFCGDPFDDGDNIACVEDGVKASSFIGIDLFESPTIALGFNTLSRVSGFSIDVAAAPVVTSVPEPATLALLGGGLLGVFGGASRRRRSI